VSISPIGSINTSVATEVVQPQRLSEEDRTLIRAVKSVNASGLMGDSNEVTYMIDRASQRLVVRVVNRESGEVVNQIPAEYILKMAEKVCEG
jgi:flagellar protein FlaG